MSEEVQFSYDSALEQNEKVVKHLEHELLKIRAGKASPIMLESIYVDYYGVRTPLNQVANIATPDPRSLVVQPWDKNMMEPIDKAIQAANLGFNPQNNGDLLRISVPPLTEERRKQLVKQVKTEGETAKVGIRNVRRDANEELKGLKKDGLSEDDIKEGEEKIQKLTDQFIKKVDEILDAKEKDIMSI
ncbi:MAG: ribosome recycling factor [Bacteroidetes bacterium GWA2_32_17]|nr:MAG: ribosome recycling factor [Bacteroidetes bacterium GWA2_32_17]